MRAACRARSTRRMPQVKGSSKERRSATLTPPSTIDARSTSCPPFARASGGTERAWNYGAAIDHRDLVTAISSPIAHGLYGLHHLADVRQRELLEVRGIGHRHVLAGDAHDRRVEVVECLLHDLHADLGGDAGLRPALLDDDAARRLLHRGDDC